MGSLRSSSHSMRVLAGILFLSLSLVDAHPQANLHVADGRIIGGDVAPKHAFPWQISLRSLGSHTCGGAVINQNLELTTGVTSKSLVTRGGVLKNGRPMEAGTTLHLTMILQSSLSASPLTSQTQMSSQ